MLRTANLDPYHAYAAENVRFCGVYLDQNNWQKHPPIGSGA